VRYVDDTCNKPALGINVQCGLPTSTAAALLIPNGTCGVPSLVALGEQHSGAVSSKADAACVKQPEEPAALYFELGAKFAADTLPKLGFVDEGSGRLRSRFATSESGEVVAPVGFVDTVSGQECYPIKTSAGLRCIPKVGAHALFADTACQKPLAEVYRGGDCQAATAPSGVLSRVDSECDGSTFRYFKVAGETKPVDLFLSGATCEKATIDTTSTSFYETTEVPATDFASLSEVTE
jgi:hypothetical protein